MSVSIKKQGIIMASGITNANILQDTYLNISNSSYNIKRLNLNSFPTAGTTVTMSIKGQLGEGKTSWGIYNSGGSVAMASLLPTDMINGVYVKSFLWKITSGSTTASNTYVNIYAMPSSVSVASSIEWVKLEYGDVCTIWTPGSTDEIHVADICGYTEIGNNVANIGKECISAINFIEI